MPPRKKPGSKKGQPKPLKRTLDAGFPGRLASAMTTRHLDVPKLAKKAGCTRAALHNYLDKQEPPKQIETFLLFSIADALEISPRWLLLPDQPAMDREISLTPDQGRVLNTASRIKGEELLNKWISIGEDYTHVQPDLVATTGNPFPNAKVKQ